MFETLGVDARTVGRARRDDGNVAAVAERPRDREVRVEVAERSERREDDAPRWTAPRLRPSDVRGAAAGGFRDDPGVRHVGKIRSGRARGWGLDEIPRRKPSLVVSLVYSPDYTLEWPGQVFPIEKYRLVHERVLAEGIVRPEAVSRPEPASDALLALVHSEAYLRRLDRLTADPVLGYREFEVPVSAAVLRAFRSATGGTLLAARCALAGVGTGASRAAHAGVNLGGGFHHAFADRGEGFCLLNDVAVAVRALEREGRLARTAILDCDLHQGNGTAKIFEDDPDVFTFSIHQENLYPPKERSDWDVGLPDFAADGEYLESLGAAVPKILDRHRPDLVVYVAGADPFEEDQLGDLRLSKEGFVRRDRIVFGEARARGIPVVAVLAGGYARRTEDVVDIHVAMVREAVAHFGPPQEPAS
jgi:acetoin utilization deacetylase AcuC-like enzyme